MLFSPDFGSLVLGWEYSLQCDAPVHYQIRLPVLVGLASSGIADGARTHGSQIGSPSEKGRPSASHQISAWLGGIRSRGGLQGMAVQRYLACEQGVVLLAARLPQIDTVAEADRRAALQVGQRESYPPVPAVGGPEKRKQRLILSDRHELSIALRPALSRVIPGSQHEL